MKFFQWGYIFTTFTTFYLFYCSHYWFFGFVFQLDTWLFHFTPIFWPKTTDNIWALEMYMNSSNIEINRNPNFDMSLWYNYSSQYTYFFVNSLTHLLSCLCADSLQLTWHILHVWWCVGRDAFNHFEAAKQNNKLNNAVEPFH
jgi:hypothetical protein